MWKEGTESQKVLLLTNRKKKLSRPWHCPKTKDPKRRPFSPGQMNHGLKTMTVAQSQTADKLEFQMILTVALWALISYGLSAMRIGGDTSLFISLTQGRVQSRRNGLSDEWVWKSSNFSSAHHNDWTILY